MKKILYLCLLFVFSTGADLLAQCAMCRATVENNLSNGDIGIGAGLNFGILYLFVMPYLAISIVGFLWYKRSKANALKYEKMASYSKR